MCLNTLRMRSKVSQIHRALWGFICKACAYNSDQNGMTGRPENGVKDVYPAHASSFILVAAKNWVDHFPIILGKNCVLTRLSHLHLPCAINKIPLADNLRKFLSEKKVFYFHDPQEQVIVTKMKVTWWPDHTENPECLSDNSWIQKG